MIITIITTLMYIYIYIHREREREIVDSFAYCGSASPEFCGRSLRSPDSLLERGALLASMNIYIYMYTCRERERERER